MANESVMIEALAVVSDMPVARVLEAGCGSQLKLRLPFPHSLVGIDIDAEQLAHNDRIDQKICGDLQTFPLPISEFDLVTCIDVLEHLRYPEKAIENMRSSLKPGGYLMIAGPEPYSYKGFVAKYTPYSMRHFLFKLLTGRVAKETLYTHGNSKIFFPTHLKPVCSLSNLTAFCERSGMRVLFAKGYDAHSEGLRGVYRNLLTTISPLTRSVLRRTNGKINLLHADYVALFQS